MEKNNPCLVIGIAGGSGSGKTTFCRQLAASLHLLKVKTISTDDYFQEIKPNVMAPFNEKPYDDYDHPCSLNIDKLMNDLHHAIACQSFDVVIIEGLLVLYFEEIREQLDLKLFVDCPSDERLIRRLKRDMHEQTFAEISAEYLDLVRHRHHEFVEPTRWHAHLVINGSTPSNDAIEVVRKWVL